MSLNIGKLSLMLSMSVGLSMAAGCGGGPFPEAANDIAAPAASTVILDGLMWTAEDNGQDIDWNNSSAYCEELTLDGFTDWGLATVSQLESLYDPTESYIPEGGGLL